LKSNTSDATFFIHPEIHKLEYGFKEGIIILKKSWIRLCPWSSGTLASTLVLATCLIAQEKDVTIRLKSSAWFEVGRVMHSTDTLNALYNYNDNWLQSVGAQFTIIADIGETMQGAMGLGGFQNQSQVGTIIHSQAASIGFERYVTEARCSFFLPDRKKSLFKFDIGLFPFNYNSNIKNLGLYLFRGPVYPGILISEFDSKSIDTTVSNIMGLHIQNNLELGDIGLFSHDIILNNERTDFAANFDFSLAYLASINLGGIIEFGTGVNFYRMLPMDESFTNLTDRSTFRIKRYSDTKSDLEYEFANMHADTIYDLVDPTIIDTIILDTLLMSHQGTKLMANLAFDPKPLFNSEVFGPNDLNIYAEAAIIGTKDYRGVYEDIMERLPIVFGFNIPAFGFLDVLALEIELYKNPYRNDYRKLEVLSSPIPMSNLDYSRRRLSNDPDTSAYYLLSSDTTLLFEDFDVENMHGDDIKWSLYLSKTFQKHAVISAQIASDHLRLTETNPFGTVNRYETAFTDIKDWYFMFQVGYLF
jgi:hypothetical protein